MWRLCATICWILDENGFPFHRQLDENYFAYIGRLERLPMLNFPPETERKLAERIRGVLQPGGRLVQYTYNLGRNRHSGLELFQAVATKVIWLNLPPARVTVHQR